VSKTRLSCAKIKFEKKKIWFIYRKCFTFGGLGGVGGNRRVCINRYDMIGLLFVVLSLLIIALVIGFNKFIALDVIFEVNDFSTPYYSFGISFIKSEHQELIIGLVFVNVVLVFYK
jgi:hypothetical protein